MPMVINESAQAHCISDLDITFAPKDNDFSGHIQNLTKKQISESFGIQVLLREGTLRVMDEKDIDAEVEARRERAKNRKHLGVELLEEASTEIGGTTYNSRAQQSFKKHLDGASNDESQALGDVITQ